MKLYPYLLPLIAQYKTKSFAQATQRWEKPIETLLEKSDGRFIVRRGSYWAYVVSNHDRNAANTKGKLAWELKLYVCVQAPYYWPCVARLIRRSKLVNCRWKFFISKNGGYERPDKIVFYCRSVEAMKTQIKSLRRFLKGCRFHEIRHAAPTSGFELEKSGKKGIYVGCDPLFNKGSWRNYRALCSAWASLNKNYLKSLPEGIEGWHERMNLSTEHEGPASLAPNPKYIPYIRRYWKHVITAAR